MDTDFGITFLGISVPFGNLPFGLLGFTKRALLFQIVTKIHKQPPQKLDVTREIKLSVELQ